LFGNPSGSAIVQVGSVNGTGRGTLSLVAHSCTLAGDYDCSGAVTPNDLAIWQNEYGGMGAQLTADGDGDDDVDGRDFLIWQRSSGLSATLNVVPEPTGIALLSFSVLAIVAVFQRDKSRRVV